MTLTDCPDPRTAHRNWAWGGLLCLLSLPVATLPCPAQSTTKSVSWWEAETALDADGQLVLTGKPWWNRAKALKVGEHFAVKSRVARRGP